MVTRDWLFHHPSAVDIFPSKGHSMSKLWKASSLKIFMALIISAGMAGAVVAEEIKIGAGAAPIENILNKIKEPMEKAIGVKVTLITNGPAQALKDLDAGIIDAAAGGVTFPDWMTMMEKEGYPIADKSLYNNRVIGRDIVKVLTNKDVTVKSLSKNQLIAIFTGKAKNWSEVGGPDLPIVVVTGTKVPGTLSVFQKQMMDGADYTKDAVESGTADDMKTKVASTSGAACLGPMSKVDATVNAPEIPEVGRPITLITKGELAGGVKKMIEYIRGEGQQFIAK